MRKLGALLVVIVTTIAVFAQSHDLVEKAKAGDIDSQLKLAYNYQFGVDGPKDIPRAVEWLRKAGVLGSSEALYRLGVLAYNGDVLGDGVEENYAISWACFEVAAVLGHSDAGRERDRVAHELIPIQMEAAQLAAARFFIEGTLAPKSVTNARSELKASMNAKSPSAAVLLGMTYLDPAIEPPDPDKAIESCLPAEKQGIPAAPYCLGKAYEAKGDEKSAFKYFEKAAKYGIAAAMLNVANRYHLGRGTKVNDVLAAAWAMNARGFEGAPELYRTLTANFTQDQIEAVQKKAAQFGGPVRGLYYRTAKQK